MSARLTHGYLDLLHGKIDQAGEIAVAAQADLEQRGDDCNANGALWLLAEATVQAGDAVAAGPLFARPAAGGRRSIRKEIGPAHGLRRAPSKPVAVMLNKLGVPSPTAAVTHAVRMHLVSHVVAGAARRRAAGAPTAGCTTVRRARTSRRHRRSPNVSRRRCSTR